MSDFFDEEKSEFAELATKEDSYFLTYALVGIAMCTFTLSTILDIHAIITKLSDKTVPVVECPRTSNPDGPVVLKALFSGGSLSQEIWVKSFLRKFLANQFAKTGVDAEKSVEWLLNHSTGSANNYFVARKDMGSKEFGEMVGRGFFYSFYPKNHKEIRIRSNGNGWKVEVDGFLVHKMGSSEVRTTPTLQYTIEKCGADLNNEFGLCVSQTNTDQYKDVVSGEKK